MQKKCQLKNGYTFNRVINGCWQLSAEHCLQGHLDYDDAIRAFHELVEQGFTTFDCADILVIQSLRISLFLALRPANA